MTRGDRAILLLFSAAVTAMAVHGFLGYHYDRQASFATEYGYLAENLALGHGFAGTFEVGGPPSAWMPPLLSVLMAAVFLGFGIKTVASLKVLLALQVLMLCFCMLLLLRLAARASTSSRWPLALLFAGYIWVGRDMFHRFADIAPIMLLSLLALHALVVLSEGRLAWPCGCAFLLPLASPALTLAYAVLVPLAAGPDASVSRWPFRIDRRVLAVWTCLFLSVGCWTARNAVVLGALVPVKSNLWFDAYQANVLDADGVVGDSTFFRFSPSGGDPCVRAAYRGGEIDFMRVHKTATVDYLKQHPETLGKVFTRFLNAAWILQPDVETWPMERTLDAQTQAYLGRRHLVLGTPRGANWTCLDLEADSLARQLEGLEAEERDRLMLDWLKARGNESRERQDWRWTTWGLGHAFLPSLAILYGFLCPGLRRRREFRLAVGLYIVYLAPYVLVSHYVRYQLALVGLSSYLLWLAWAGHSQTLSSATESARSSGLESVNR